MYARFPSCLVRAGKLSLLPLALVTVAGLLAGCSVAESGAGPGIARERVLLATDVTGRESLVGLVADGDRSTLLTSGQRLVTVDLARRRAETVAIEKLADTDDLAGLARAADGTLWALVGWNRLVQLERTGRVVSTIALTRRHVSISSGPEGIVYQPATPTAGIRALEIGPPGEARRQPFGSLRVRGADRDVLRVIHSFIRCGGVGGEVLPCWMVNDAAIDLIDASGQGRRVPIAALEPHVQADAMAFADRPGHIIRDARVAGDEIWMLAPSDVGAVRDPSGERTLWQVSLAGAVRRTVTLGTPARILLAADSGGVVLLNAAGHVVRVEP